MIDGEGRELTASDLQKIRLNSELSKLDIPLHIKNTLSHNFGMKYNTANDTVFSHLSGAPITSTPRPRTAATDVELGS